MSHIYRLARLEDAEELLGLTLRAYEPIRKLNIKFPAATADLELVKQNIIQHTCYVLEVDQSIVSTITIRRFEEITDLPCVWWFAVDTEFKGKGYGKRILQYVEEDILRDRLNAKAVALGTSDRHPWLIEMYERNGYVRFYERDYGEEGKGVFLKKELVHELSQNL
ncbi:MULTISPECIES: GNAT family N-acetyltransferase [Metabacillus]|uniref:GNAT family N-acetyltransferase n=1 Tax=Metabacillus hrfriensis TaxID=3048891 RepID=A0ACD4R6M1_9BACI|nr:MULTISPECIES: GNAT family N-acetyltransferase [Metabacillus]UAL50607.1 GNAT family N-acetyltransferase [Metabacillus dongyingensis]UOK59900.1 GNAT family N-acetyltransferase [Bacillus sp. OVS6]USK26873.1 GNAT family N-acetyltransferase [Bacillus sp. CMF21]WHZ56103.1 GNAT family N-acetyltransferase [Metabacillus sp. CT-WN-B3]